MLSIITNRSKMRLITLGLFILIISKVRHVTSNDCLHCRDVNRVNTNCVKNYAECDDCLDRFIPDPSDSDSERCIEIKIVSHSPEHLRAALGDEVVLRCQFNVDVVCHWTLNGADVHPAPKRQYRYVNKQAEDGGSTTNCTLAISSTKKQDYGKWQCSNKATHDITVPVYSKFIQLLPMEKVIVHPYRLIDVAFGGNVILHASFDHPVECVWFKKLGGKFSKVLTDEHHHFLINCGAMRDNCSLIIRNVDDNDSGDYQCNATATDYRDAIGTKITHLNVIRTIPNVIFHPTNKTNVTLDQKVELKCEFSSEVNCEWLHNGSAVVIDGEMIGFRGCNGNWTKDCSIIVYDFQPRHVGWYKCVNRDNKIIASEEVYVSLGESRIISQSNFRPIILGIFIVISLFAGIFGGYYLAKYSILQTVRKTICPTISTGDNNIEDKKEKQVAVENDKDCPQGQANADNEQADHPMVDNEPVDADQDKNSVPETQSLMDDGKPNNSDEN